MIDSLLSGFEFEKPVSPVELLPASLRSKIWRLKPLTPEQKIINARMSASIYPLKYKNISVMESAALRDAERGTSEKERGAAPPITNRGGKVRCPSVDALEKLKLVSVTKGRPIFVAVPLPDKSSNINHSFIDWVNFTFKKAHLTLLLPDGCAAKTDHDYVVALSVELNKIFGYGVSGKRLNGLNFYFSSYDLGQNGWGHVCIGGQNDTVLVTVKGQGLMSASPGWELRLHKFLSRITSARLTRVDLASDHFQSSKTMEYFLSSFDAGLFQSTGRPPNIEMAGNWLRPNGKGRTLYIGSRGSGKLLRIYEKGLQLANGFHELYPNWIRIELELKNIDREIPLDCLLCPGQYLAGAYPALKFLFEVQERIQTFKKTVESTFKRAIETTRHQFGKYIWVISQIKGYEEAIRLLTDGKEEIPKNLNFDTYQQYDQFNNIHLNINRE